MFNLNTPSSLLGIEGSGLGTTPKTPEIVNSLIAMTNPLDNYNFSTVNGNNNNSAASTPGSAVSARSFGGAPNAQCMSQDSSHSSSSASPLDSPAGTNTTPSVQQTCSQLIKAGLKLSIQSKRKLSTCDSSSGSDQPMSKCSRRDEDCDDSSDEESENKSTPKGLTPEDEDRRRRRRERNKIAATKCRMKKRERTQNLIKESEQLETQNIDLKTQVRGLETERRRLLEMLQAHTPSCVHRGGLNLPSKLLTSPAYKYLAALELEDAINASNGGGSTPAATPHSGPHAMQQLQQAGNPAAVTLPPRTVIPPMSTIKVSRNNGFKVAAAVSQQLHQLPMQTAQLQQQQQHQQHQQQQQQHSHLPNGYCKPSPTAQELGYLNSPSQENLCLPAILPQHTAQTPTAHQVAAATAAAAAAVLSGVNGVNGAAVSQQQLSDYIPNCDNNLASLGLGHVTTATSNGGDSSVLLGGMVSPLSVVTTPTTATEFVKNELVDSQSPYTTAQSAERFLFESNCDSFVDIKHAVSLHPGSHHNNNNTIASLNNNGINNNNNLLDFHTSLMGGAGSIGPFHDQISIKNDFCPEADLLATLVGAEFVDLDTSVSTPFMTNNGCLA